MLKKAVSLLLAAVYALSLPQVIKADSGNELNELYIAEDFENGTGGFSAYGGYSCGIKNTADIITSGGNSYLFLKKNITGSDCYADFYIGKTKRDVIIEFDMKVNNFGVEAMPLYVRDSTSSPEGRVQNDWLLYLTKNGLLKSRNGSYQMTELSWIHAVLMLNLDNKTYSVSINNNWIDKNSTYSSLDIYALDMLRIYAGSGVGNLCVDNFNVYSGTKTRKISGEKAIGRRNQLMKSDKYAELLLKDKAALQTQSGVMYADGVRTACAAVPVDEDGEAYVCAADAAALLGAEVAEENDAFVIDGIRYLKDSYISENGSQRVMNVCAVTKRSGTYTLPLMQIAADLGKFTVNDGRGTYVISDATLENMTSQQLKELSCYMFFEREAADDYYSLLNTKPQQHPSVLIDTDGFERLKAEIKTDSRLAGWHSRLLQSAEALLEEDIPVYKKDGIRIMNICNSVQIRISKFAYAYNMTGDERFADRAWEIMEAVCTRFPDWNADSHFLDTGIMAYTAGLYYDWFYSWLNSEQKSIVYNATKKYAFDKAMGAYYGTDSVMANHFFVNGTTNWGGVCNGGIGVAAMAMLEQDTPYLLDVVSSAARSLESTVYEIGPDGAWEEGVGYWLFYLTYLARFMKTYDIVFDGKNNFAKFKGMESFGYFSSVMSSEEGNNNFHDSSLEIYVPDAMLYLAEACNDSALVTQWLKLASKNNIAADVDTMCYYKSATGSASDKSNVYYREVEAVAIKEKSAADDGMFFSAHGGKTVGAHNHYDAGAFVYDALGERWAIDLGAPDYDNQDVLGKDNMYRVRSEGHNTLTINPDLSPGQNTDGFAEVTRFEHNEKAAISVFDLTSMYSACTKAERGFFVSDNRRSLTVRDEFTVKSDSVVYWFMHTDADIAKVNNNTFKMTKNGKAVTLSVLFDGGSAEVYIANPIPMEEALQSEYQDDNADVKKIAVKLNTGGSASITVKLSPEGEGIDTAAENTSLSEWSLPPVTETYDNEKNFGIYGREENDASMFSDSARIDSGIARNPDGISEHICFYAAFEGEKRVEFLGKMNGGANEQRLTVPIEADNSGSLTVCGTKILDSGFDLISGKWYKIDMLIKTGEENTVSVWLDNICIAESVGFLPNSSVEEITAIAVPSAYIDDYVHKNTDSVQLPALTLASTEWEYRRYMMTKYGYYTFCDDNAEISQGYLDKLAKKNISAVKIVTADTAFKEKYLLLTDSMQNTVYMPVFDLGKSIYNGTDSWKAFDKTPLAAAPYTLKFNIKPRSGSEILLDSAAVMSADESYMTLLGGKRLEYTPNKAYEITVCIYPMQNKADIYIDGSATALKAALTAPGGYRINAAEIASVKCFSGGRKCDLRAAFAENEYKLWIKSAFDEEADLCEASYNDERLTDVKLQTVQLGCKPASFEAENSAMRHKLMLWSNLSEQKPMITAFEY